MSAGPRASAERLHLAADARGVVVEPLPPDAFAAQRNAHVVVTVPGQVRGNHVHRLGTEVALVLGPALVRVRDADGERDLDVPAGEAWRVVLPPGAAHAFRGRGPDPMLIVSFNTHPHDPAAPDVERVELLAPE